VYWGVFDCVVLCLFVREKVLHKEVDIGPSEFMFGVGNEIVPVQDVGMFQEAEIVTKHDGVLSSPRISSEIGIKSVGGDHLYDVICCCTRFETFGNVATYGILRSN
jgi:hypothetical protein